MPLLKWTFKAGNMLRSPRLISLLVIGVFLTTHSEAGQYFCDFTTANLCNQWSQDTTDDFDWTRHSRATPDGNTGPVSGYGGQGYYMYFEGDGPPPNSKARLQSLELGRGAVRVSFWCSLYGANMGYLKVFKKTGNQYTQVGETVQNQKTRDWIFRSFKFDCFPNCKVVFEATRGNGWSSDIAIDHVTIDMKWHTHLNAVDSNVDKRYCNFDNNTCPEYWSQDNTDDFDWIYAAGKTDTGDTGPLSGYNGIGHYFLMDASYHTSGQKGRLQSEVITEANVTLTFWYLVYGYDIGRLQVYTKSADSTNVLWTIHGGNGIRKWLKKRLNFLCENTCRVVFEAERGVFIHGDIAIDEITLNISRIIPDVSQAGAQREFCDFDSSLSCGWKQDPSNDVKWELWKGSTPKRNTGPTGDFTTGRGNYALFQDSTDRFNLSAVLTSPLIRAPFWRQLKFAYHMLQYHNQTSTLKVYKKFESSVARELLVAIPRKKGVSKWQILSLNVTSQEPYVIQIVAVGGSGGYGDIALDNIELTSGIQPEIANCKFNRDFCKWTQSTSDTFDWLLHTGETPSSGTGPTGQSQYAYTEASFPRVNGDVAILESEAIGPLGNQSVCLRFLYNMNGKHVGLLQLIRADRRGNSKSVIWGLSGNQGQQWEKGHVTVKFVNDDVFRFHFKSQRGNGIHGDIAIKDVMTEMRPCQEESPYDCNFENDMCNWIQTANGSANWTLSTIPTKDPDSIPLADHTIGSTNGSYVYVSDVDARPSIHVTVKTKESLCVSFWYFSYGSNGDPIDFVIQTASTTNITWTYTSDTITWQHARVTVQSNKVYNMGFKAKASDSFKAIDDIVVTKGACA